ncbi:MAG: GNAT family N-acetyltransferase [Anaerolineae bacterium]
MSHVAIRFARPDDAPSLADLAARVFARTYGAAIPADILQPYLARSFAPDAVAAEIAAPGATHLLALEDGALIGYSKLELSPLPPCLGASHAVELSKLYVDAAHHSRGVGASLLLRTVAEAGRKGWNTLWLCVWEHNPRAIAFYHKWGFEIVGRTHIYVDTIVFHDHVMERRLTAEAQNDQ